MRMDETIGTMNYDGLIHDAKHNLDVQGVKIRAAQGALKRGTVLALSSRDSKHVILGTTAADAIEAAAAVYGATEDTALVAGKTYYTRSGSAGSYVYTAVEAPDVANIATYYEITTAAVEAQAAEALTASCILTDDVDATAEAFAVAYRSGHFNTNALIVKEGYTITAADKNNLRDGGVFLSAAVEL